MWGPRGWTLPFGFQFGSTVNSTSHRAGEERSSEQIPPLSFSMDTSGLLSLPWQKQSHGLVSFHSFCWKSDAKIEAVPKSLLCVTLPMELLQARGWLLLLGYPCSIPVPLPASWDLPASCSVPEERLLLPKVFSSLRMSSLSCCAPAVPPGLGSEFLFHFGECAREDFGIVRAVPFVPSCPASPGVMFMCEGEKFLSQVLCWRGLNQCCPSWGIPNLLPEHGIPQESTGV